VRIDVLDPAAYTPPYDHALCAALARARARVRLVSGPFRHGPVPSPDGYARVERPRWRHVVAPATAAADVRHFQWLPLQELDQLLVRLIPRPWVLTAHDVLPREPRRGQARATRRVLRAADAVVVHSEHGAARLRELGVAAPEVIPHGLLDPGPPGALPAELRDDGTPVVLLFGLLRPYKGLDVLLDAWPGVPGGQLWVVGAPRMTLPAALPARTQLVPRFVGAGEASALLHRADVVVLPYREIDQSGVLFAALHAGRPLVLSAVGGFPEVGAGALVPPGDAGALAAVLARLVADRAERERLAAESRAAARERFGWDEIAARHLALYRRLGA
jgi:glycosyltransferase involved in cell wall biosynthesis